MQIAAGGARCFWYTRPAFLRFSVTADNTFSEKTVPANTGSSKSSDGLARSLGPQSQATGTDLKGSILVVDDEPGIVDSLQRIFEKDGLKVYVAEGERRHLRS